MVTKILARFFFLALFAIGCAKSPPSETSEITEAPTGWTTARSRLIEILYPDPEKRGIVEAKYLGAEIKGEAHFYFLPGKKAAEATGRNGEKISFIVEGTEYTTASGCDRLKTETTEWRSLSGTIQYQDRSFTARARFYPFHLFRIFLTPDLCAQVSLRDFTLAGLQSPVGLDDGTEAGNLINTVGRSVRRRR